MATTDLNNATPERIRELSENIRSKLTKTVKEIDAINLQIRLLSVNAQIEAARAGDAGRSFAVVASSMGDLAGRTSHAADDLSEKLRHDIDEMSTISERLGRDVRGARLADMALNNIDLVDRNLYERTCDVRWWATDKSLVDACANPDDPQISQFASRRLGVILDAYTVYFDLVLCDLQGRVIANGRPKIYQSVGMDASRTQWFESARASANGSAFGFQGVHASPFVRGERVVAYSCKVHLDGELNREATGVLGILFNWDSLAQTIVLNTPLDDREKEATRVVMVDGRGAMLADNQDNVLQDTLAEHVLDSIKNAPKGFMVTQYDYKPSIVAYAAAPGFETYSTGWYSVIIQTLVKNP